MKMIIKQKQIIKPTNGWCGDVHPELGAGDRMNCEFYDHQTSGARGAPE